MRASNILVGLFAAGVFAQAVVSVRAAADPPAGHGDTIVAAAFAPKNAGVIYTAGLDGEVKAWDLLTNQPKWSVAPPSASKAKLTSLWALAVSPDGGKVAVAGGSAVIRILSASDGKPIHELKGHGDTVFGLAFHPDGTKLASCARDNFVKVWELPASGEPKLLRTISGHTDAVWDVRFSPQGDRLASSSSDGTIKIWKLADGSLEHNMTGHSGAVWGIAYSGDGKSLVSRAADKTVRFWDPVRGKFINNAALSGAPTAVAFAPGGAAIATAVSNENGAPQILINEAQNGGQTAGLSGHAGRVRVVAYSPDGKRLVTAGEDRCAIVWDLAANKWTNLLRGREVPGSEDQVVMAHTGSIHAAVFSPDGKLIATAGNDSVVKIWEASSRRQLFILDGASGTVWALAFSPGGEIIAAGGDDGVVHLWNVKDGSRAGELKGPHGTIRALLFKPGAGPATLFSAGEDSTIRIWDIAAKKETGKLARHINAIQALAISRDGKLLASGSKDWTIKLWNLEHPSTDLESSSIDEPRAPISSLAFDESGKRLFTCSDDGLTLGLDLEKSGARSLVFRSEAGPARGVVVLPGDRSIVIATGADGAPAMLSRFSLTAGRLEARRTAPAPGAVRTLAASPDGKLVISGGDDQVLRVFRADESLKSAPFIGHTKAIRSFARSRDGKEIATGGDDGLVIIWDVESREPKVRLFAGSPVQKLAFSRDGKLLAVAEGSGLVKIWDLIEKKERITLQQQMTNINCMDFAYDNRNLAIVAGGGHEINLFGITMSAQLKKLEDPDKSRIRSISFSPDGSSLASAHDNKTVKVWDLAAASVRLTLKGHAKEVFAVAYSPDSATIASAGLDRSLRLWDSSAGRPVATMRGARRGIVEIAWSDDGKTIASRSLAGEGFDLWDLKAERVVARAKPRDRAASSAFLFLSEKKSLVTYDMDDIVFTDVAPGAAALSAVAPPAKRGTEIVLGAHEDVVRHAAFEGEGFVLTRSDDGIVRVFEAGQGALVQTLGDGSVGNSARSLAIRKRNESRLAVVGFDQGKTELRRSRPNMLNGFSGNAPPAAANPAIIGLAIRPDLKEFAGALGAGGVGFWKVDENGSVERINPTPPPAQQPADLPKEVDQLNEATTKAQPTPPPPPPPDLPGNGDNAPGPQGPGGPAPPAASPQLAAEFVVYTADGATLISATSQGTIVFWDAVAHAIRTKIELGARTELVALSPNGETLAVVFSQSARDRDDSSGTQVIGLWKVASAERIATLSGAAGTIQRIAFAPDSQSLATTGDHSGLVIWDLNARCPRMQALASEPKGDFPYSLAFSNNAKTLAIGMDQGSVILLDPATLKAKARFEGHSDRVEWISFDQQDKRAVSASRDATARIWTLP